MVSGLPLLLLALGACGSESRQDVASVSRGFDRESRSPAQVTFQIHEGKPSHNWPCHHLRLTLAPRVFALVE